MGDGIGAGVIHSLSTKELEEMDKQEKENKETPDPANNSHSAWYHVRKGLYVSAKLQGCTEKNDWLKSKYKMSLLTPSLTIINWETDWATVLRQY